MTKKSVNNYVLIGLLILTIMIVLFFSKFYADAPEEINGVTNYVSANDIIDKRRCTDWVDLGIVDSELRHKPLYGWAHENTKKALETYYGNEDFYDENGMNYRSGKYELGFYMNLADPVYNKEVVLIYKPRYTVADRDIDDSHIYLGDGENMSLIGEFKHGDEEFVMYTFPIEKDIGLGEKQILVEDRDNANEVDMLIHFLGICEVDSKIPNKEKVTSPSQKIDLNKCLDWVDLGNQENELLHKGLLGWGEPGKTKETYYGNESFYDLEKNVSIRSGRDKLGVILFVNESIIGRKLIIVHSSKSKGKADPTKVFMGDSLNLDLMEEIGSFELSNSDYELTEFELKEDFGNKIYVVIDDEDNYWKRFDMKIDFMGIC